MKMVWITSEHSPLDHGKSTLLYLLYRTNSQFDISEGWDAASRNGVGDLWETWSRFWLHCTFLLWFKYCRYIWRHLYDRNSGFKSFHWHLILNFWSQTGRDPSFLVGGFPLGEKPVPKRCPQIHVVQGMGGLKCTVRHLGERNSVIVS